MLLESILEDLCNKKEIEASGKKKKVVEKETGLPWWSSG